MAIDSSVCALGPVFFGGEKAEKSLAGAVDKLSVDCSLADWL